MTPMVIVDPVRGKPAEVVNEIVAILQRLREAWR